MSAAILHKPEAGLSYRAQITVRLKLLEDLLECLAQAPFPLSPELEHDTLRGMSLVRFSVYGDQIDALRDILVASGFPSSAINVSAAFEEMVLDPEYERSL